MIMWTKDAAQILPSYTSKKTEYLTDHNTDIPQDIRIHVCPASRI